MTFMNDFVTSESFPTKKHWKRIVNEALQGKEELVWSEKLNQKPVLKLYIYIYIYMEGYQYLETLVFYMKSGILPQ
jgi:hypothetical protein